LRQTHAGETAQVMLMDGRPVDPVQGFAAGQRAPSPTLLANFNHVPAGTKLIAGMTCTVVIRQTEVVAFEKSGVKLLTLGRWR
jgi:hypothetical protein